MNAHSSTALRPKAIVVAPVRQVAPIGLSDLKEVDGQKERMLRNTAQFVAGQPADLQQFGAVLDAWYPSQQGGNAIAAADSSPRATQTSTVSMNTPASS